MRMVFKDQGPEASLPQAQPKDENQGEPSVSGPDSAPATKIILRYQVAMRAWSRTNGHQEGLDLLTSQIVNQLNTFSIKNLLFYFRLDLGEFPHQCKKNGKNIVFNKKLGRSILTKSATFEKVQAHMIGAMQLQARAQGITKPFEGRFWMMAHFYFPKHRYFTKANEISETLPDLSNLLELPQDCMQPPKVLKSGKRAGQTVRQGAGIISNDSHIDSLDGCRRLPGDGYRIEIFLLRYGGHDGPSSAGSNQHS